MIKAVIFDWINTLYSYEQGLYPFSKETLDYLKPKYSLGLVTLALPGIKERKEEIKKSGLENYFKVVVIELKKTGEEYLKCVNSLGFSPEECVVVDDQLGNILAAQSVGCGVYWVTGVDKEEVGIKKVTSVAELDKFL